jgi:hypothetical protein
MKRLAVLLGLIAMWLPGCLAGKRLSLPVSESLAVGVDGSRSRRLLGVKLPGKLTLGRMYLRSQPYALEPLTFEFQSGMGVSKRGLRGLFLGGRVGLSFRVTDYLYLSVNSSTLLAFMFPNRSRLGFCVKTQARISI